MPESTFLQLYKYIFWFEITDFQISHHKEGIILENKVVQKLMLSKNSDNKTCFPKLIFLNERKSEIFGWFLTSKLDFESQWKLNQNKILNFFLIFISRNLNKNLNENSEEMLEIGQAGTQDSEGLFQPSRFKRLTMNLNLFQEPNASDQESSKQNCGAKLCEFSFTAAY